MTIGRFWRWRYIAPAAIVMFPLFLALVGQVVKLLWNWLLPPLFNLPMITAWQGLGLVVLGRILFGGFGRGGGGGSSRMTREERERVRARMRERFCPPTSTDVAE